MLLNLYFFFIIQLRFVLRAYLQYNGNKINSKIVLYDNSTSKIKNIEFI
jgi:hypothetical protein